jgi:hypothetical protein
MRSPRRRAEPKVRRDGLCVVCRGPRYPERSRKYGKTVAELDPFCSTECAKSYFGAEKKS